MNRIEVIQHYINLYNYEKYLEIGTFQGDSFLPVICRYKIAVDPEFKISKKKKLSWLIRNPWNIRNRYFEMSSDEFFKNHNNYLFKLRGLDIIFIDGLHTFESSLKDVLNSLQYIKADGIIIMHDCFPPTQVSATPGNSLAEVEAMKLPGWKGEWCGDVWKSIIYLKRLYEGKLEITVLNTDYGLGIIRYNRSEIIDFNINHNLFNEINEMPFNHLKRDPSIINLQDVDYIKTL